MIRRVSIVLIALLAVALIGALIFTLRERKKFAVWAHRGLSPRKIQFKWVKLASFLCGCYALTVTFTEWGKLGSFGGIRNPNTGWVESNNITQSREGIYQYTSFINSEKMVTRSIVAYNIDQSILLGISRFSGFSLYPYIFFIMFTKFRATLAFLHKTPLRVLMIQDTHALHAFAGWFIFFVSMLHSICHCLRWVDQGNIQLLWTNPQGCNPSGISGLIVVVSTFIIVLPMTALKNKIRFEVRKYAHYSFFVFFIAMTVHAPFWALPNGGFCRFVFPILLLWYILDAAYVKVFLSEQIAKVEYRVLDSGVEVTMSVSKRFQDNLASGGYGYVMAPWISEREWHAFSIYENPLDPTLRHMFLAGSGDWTKEIQRTVQNIETPRPLWISGPFPSPYKNCFGFDNMICVASEMGITSALSAIEAFRETRRVNLIWAVRDASMLVFFLENAKLDDGGLNFIFYTGKDPLPGDIENYNMSHKAHLEIIHSSPLLHHLIPNMIHFFENPSSDYHLYELWKRTNKAESEPDSKTKSSDLEDPSEQSVSNFSWISPGSDIVAIDPASKACTTTYDSGVVWVAPGTDIMARLSTNRGDDDTGRTERTYTDRSHHRSMMVDSTGEILSLDPETPKKPSKVPVPTKQASSSSTAAAAASLVETESKESLPSFPKKPCLLTTQCAKSVESTHRKSKYGKHFGKAAAQFGQPEVWEKDADARAYVKDHMPSSRKDTWGILYCGNRNSLIQEDLVKESKDLKVALYEESFRW